MQDVSPVRPVAKVAILIACPLLSALTFAALALGVAAVIGAAHVVTIGLVVAAAVFVANAAALCIALTRGEDDERVDAAAVVDADAVAHALAS